MSPTTFVRSAFLAALLLLLASPAHSQGNKPGAPGRSGNVPGQNSNQPTPSNPNAGPGPGQGGNSTASLSSNTGGNAAGAMASSEKPKPHEPNPNASANANAIQAVLQKFDASRDKIVNDRKVLLDKLAAAKNDVERESILAQLRTEQQSVKDEQRQTAREIRAELQTLRRQRSGP